MRNQWSIKVAKMKFFLLTFLVINVINRISAFNKCEAGPEDPKLIEALNDFFAYFPFDQLRDLNQDFQPECMEIYNYMKNFTSTLEAAWEVRFGFEVICLTTYFDLPSWWSEFWRNLGMEYPNLLIMIHSNFLVQKLMSQIHPHPHLIQRLTRHSSPKSSNCFPRSTTSKNGTTKSSTIDGRAAWNQLTIPNLKNFSTTLSAHQLFRLPSMDGKNMDLTPIWLLLGWKNFFFNRLVVGKSVRRLFLAENFNWFVDF